MGPSYVDARLVRAPLLGAVTLETLGLMVSPVSRKLLPMRMLLGSESVVPK